MYLFNSLPHLAPGTFHDADGGGGQGQAQNGEETKAEGSQEPTKQSDQSGGSQAQSNGQNIDLTKFASTKYNEGKEAGQRQLLKDLGVENVDDLKAKFTEGTKAKKQIDKFEEDPRFVELQKNFNAQKTRADILETQLRSVTIEQRLATAFSKAEDPKYAAYLFQQEHKISIDENGKAVVTDLDGNPIHLMTPEGKFEQQSLDAAAKAWFEKHNDLKSASGKGGSNSRGANQQDTTQAYTREQIAQMSPEEYQKHRAELLKSQTPA